MKVKPFGEKRDVEVGRDGHETSSREVTHTEDLTHKGGPPTLKIGVQPSKPNRGWEARAGLGGGRNALDFGLGRRNRVGGTRRLEGKRFGRAREEERKADSGMGRRRRGYGRVEER